MFTAENEDVLVAFQALCEQYPRENPVALWEMAGGQTAAEQSVQADGACPHTVNHGDQSYCNDCDTVFETPRR